MIGQKFKHRSSLCVNPVKQVSARCGQHGPSAFQPRLVLFEHRNAVGKPADFNQFTLDFSQLVTNLAQRPVDLVKHLKQTHTGFAPLIRAARYRACATRNWGCALLLKVSRYRAHASRALALRVKLAPRIEENSRRLTWFRSPCG